MPIKDTVAKLPCTPGCTSCDALNIYRQAVEEWPHMDEEQAQYEAEMEAQAMAEQAALDAMANAACAEAENNQ